VMDAVDSLPEILRVVFQKYIFEGFSRTRLAQVLGLERHRVGKLLTAAIEEIRRLLNSDP
jgi:DNA-directed RNA polymerase specialized sigma24 family protein